MTIKTKKENIALMEPMLPAEGARQLEDLAVDLVHKASGLAGHLAPVVRDSIGDLVRSMNCYYSNLIEGHDTHPRDIDRALANDYSKDSTKRVLQKEAVAHIEVQRIIDQKNDPQEDVTSSSYITWLHHEFCSRLPDELLWAENPDTGTKVRVEAGKLRDGYVQVGRHIAPAAEGLPAFLKRFEDAYSSTHLSKLRQIIAVGAAHHRFLWIHPFYDGNGRVVRLMSHAWLQRLGVGSSMWSVARGLARNVKTYKDLLMAADEPRRGDLDGRGSLSESALTNFCRFFLETALDQVAFMESILEPTELLRRMQRYVEDEIDRGHLLKNSFPLLREALLAGEIPRGKAEEITGYGDRMARKVVSKLIERGLLKSPSPRAPLTLGFPIDAVEAWFPKLYPVR